MSWSDKPYWFKGGMWGLILSVPFTLFVGFLVRFFNVQDDVLFILGPELMAAGWSLAMGGGNQILTIGMGLGLFLLRFFIMGAVLGGLYSLLAWPPLRFLFWLGLLVVLPAGLFILFYRYQDYGAIYNSVNSTEDCHSYTMVVHFDVEWCYRAVAIKKRDKTICDIIKKEEDRKVCIQGVNNEIKYGNVKPVRIYSDPTKNQKVDNETKDLDEPDRIYADPKTQEIENELLQLCSRFHGPTEEDCRRKVSGGNVNYDEARNFLNLCFNLSGMEQDVCYTENVRLW